VKWCLVLIGAVVLHRPCPGQSSTPSISFDVASVKFTSHGRNAEGLSISYVKIASPGRLVAINASLQECVEWAYEAKDYQIAGPAWIRSSDEAGYDIEAKAPPETSREQIRLMFQALLEQRFHLKLHRVQKMLPVYLLEVARNGPRLRASPEPAGSLLSRGGSEGIQVSGVSATMKVLPIGCRATSTGRCSTTPVFPVHTGSIFNGRGKATGLRRLQRLKNNSD
jgi:uncharacterized protein (TIGR03435 family)